MKHQATRVLLLALYQFSLALGILMLPVALLARQVGISLPLHRLIDGVGRKYENARQHSRA